MREIKCKAYYFHKDGAVEDMSKQDTRPGVVFKWKQEGQPVKIALATGLKDVSGVDIFEGDIVRWTSNHAHVQDTSVHIDKVVWSDEYVCYFLEPWIYEPHHAKMEVIGNIHQNPELLES